MSVSSDLMLLGKHDTSYYTDGPSNCTTPQRFPRKHGWLVGVTLGMLLASALLWVDLVASPASRLSLMVSGTLAHRVPMQTRQGTTRPQARWIAPQRHTAPLNAKNAKKSISQVKQGQQWMLAYALDGESRSLEAGVMPRRRSQDGATSAIPTQETSPPSADSSTLRLASYLGLGLFGWSFTLLAMAKFIHAVVTIPGPRKTERFAMFMVFGEKQPSAPEKVLSEKEKAARLEELGLKPPKSCEGDWDFKVLKGRLTDELNQLQDEVLNREADKEQKAQRMKESNISLMSMSFDEFKFDTKLKVRTLQLEMLFIYQGLETEALLDTEVKEEPIDIELETSPEADIVYLIADYTALDEQLAQYVEMVAQSGPVIDDLQGMPLEDLERDIPDLRRRLAIPDREVFGTPERSPRFGLEAIVEGVKQSVDKISSGFKFLSTGVNLLVADLKNTVKILARAVRGGQLAPREVKDLTRTFTDLLAFIPFTIILIIPLTPVGHVLVFGFIQRYFPGLWPSQFSERRQKLMMRYQDLKVQLEDAKRAAAENSDSAPIENLEGRVKKLAKQVAEAELSSFEEAPEDKGSKGSKADVVDKREFNKVKIDKKS